MPVTRILVAAGLAAIMAACASDPDRMTMNDRVAANAAVEPGSPDELICRSERRTGELIPRRVCMTRAERDALEREADEMFAEESVRHLRINPDGRGG
ncbi:MULTISPECIES: hypothetical protein [Hyphobacterium]|uniref:Uncharacterized protein n=1 Tax=Hyphobacterium vulgare TaxID=1736751 RepID=A0ABV6ZVZ3_9PROT